MNTLAQLLDLHRRLQGTDYGDSLEALAKQVPIILDFQSASVDADGPVGQAKSAVLSSLRRQPLDASDKVALRVFLHHLRAQLFPQDQTSLCLTLVGLVACCYADDMEIRCGAIHLLQHVPVESQLLARELAIVGLQDKHYLCRMAACLAISRICPREQSQDYLNQAIRDGNDNVATFARNLTR